MGVLVTLLLMGSGTKPLQLKGGEVILAHTYSPWLAAPARNCKVGGLAGASCSWWQEAERGGGGKEGDGPFQIIFPETQSNHTPPAMSIVSGELIVDGSTDNHNTPMSQSPCSPLPLNA